MPRHSHPVIQQIDDGLDLLDPIFAGFAESHGYEIYKSVDGDFSPPKRRLNRLQLEERSTQCISLSVDRDEGTFSLQQFGPEMPCTLIAFAAVHDIRGNRCLRRRVFSGLPYWRLDGELAAYLQTAHDQLDEWPAERVLAEGGVS